MKTKQLFWVLLVAILFTAVVIKIGERNQATQDAFNAAEEKKALADRPIPPPPKPLTAAEIKQRQEQEKRRKKEAAQQGEQLRILYAKNLENNLLRNDFNVDVIAFGPQHTKLKMKWIGVNKSLAFRFTEEQQDMLRQMKNEGFTTFTMTDGYDDSWTWTLN